MECLPAIISDLIAFNHRIEERFAETAESEPIVLEDENEEPGVRLWRFGQSVDVGAALKQLQGSERGAQALKDLKEMLRNGADQLDPHNMAAVMNLLGAAWGGRAREILSAQG